MSLMLFGTWFLYHLISKKCRQPRKIGANLDKTIMKARDAWVIDKFLSRQREGGTEHSKFPLFFQGK